MSRNLNALTKITVNNFPDSVRENPDVYISGAKPELASFSEIIANSVDEAKAGYCDTINVAIDKNDNVMVQDNGRGIPVAPCDDELHKGYSQCEVALTVLSAGGKFGADNGYKADTGGKNGMGSSVVNALSSAFVCEVAAGGSLYQVKFAKGLYVQRQKVIRKIPKKQHGTTIKYHLDPDIYENVHLEPEDVRAMCQELCFLNNGLKINLLIQDEDKVLKYSYQYEEGLKEFLNLLLEGKDLAVDSRIHLARTVPAKELPRDLSFDVSFGYTKGYGQDIRSFVNSIDTEDGGTHVQGMTQGICNAIRKYAVEQKKIKEPKDFEIGDTVRGLVGIVALKYKKPTFDRQSKTKLDMPKVRGIIARALEDEFYDYLEKSPKDAEVIVGKALQGRKERLKVKAARDEARGLKKNNSKAVTLGKLADCSCRDPMQCWLFLVEGDSAGGSAKEARDPRFQAILPIFGKIKNAIKAGMSFADIIRNEKLGLAVAAFHCGIGAQFDIRKLRYGHIVLMADADVDGAHIQILWIAFLWRYMPEIILRGYLYIPRPPLFQAKKKNQKSRFFYTANELKDAQLDSSWEISRYKGLGEMNPDELWETTMNPETSVMYRITAKDAEQASEAVELCMGQQVQPRKELIMNEVFAA